MADQVTDPRASFWREHFDLAYDYDRYLQRSDPARASRWHDMDGQIPELTDAQIARLAPYRNRTLNVLVYSGVWCGDCIRQGPMLKRVANAAGENVQLRIIEREASPKLMEELRILGGHRVPVVVFLSEDFYEVGRFGDRLLSAYRAIAVRSVGAACDTGLVAPPAEALAAELADWVDVFERMLIMVRVSPFLRSRHGD